MEQAYQYCAARVREADKDRFLATLFAPAAYRDPLFALYAFDAELAQVRDRISSPFPGEVRLQWWRDVLTGTEHGDAANPIAAALLQTVRRFTLPVPAMLDLIDTHTFDLYDEPMTTLAELESYAVGSLATMIRLAVQVLNGGTEPDQLAAFRHAAIASTITAVLQRLALHSARGQQFVPEQILARHGASAMDLQAGRISGELRAALADLRQVAGDHLVALKVGDNAIPLQWLPAFLPVALVPSALARMERASAEPLNQRLVPQWRRQWTLWRAARNPARFIAFKPNGPAESGDRQ